MLTTTLTEEELDVLARVGPRVSNLVAEVRYLRIAVKQANERLSIESDKFTKLKIIIDNFASRMGYFHPPSAE